jgi:flagellar basal-body rod protein FlgC
MELSNAMGVSASGLKAQSTRLRVIAENIANAESVATRPGGDPYRRKTVQFDNYINRDKDVDMVRVRRIRPDDSDFRKVYDPSHPAADGNGYVQMPNVNRFIETMDMKEAQRSYEANIEALNTARSMLRDTVGLLSNN